MPGAVLRVSLWMMAGTSLLRPLAGAPNPPSPETRPAPAPLVIDATGPVPEPEAGAYVGGASVAPDGRTIGVNSRYLLLDGHPWLPVMGEFHYTRVPRGKWEEEILKMKAGGRPDRRHLRLLDSSRRDRGTLRLVGAARLCSVSSTSAASTECIVVVRIGPWDHGEVSNGGFPDWLMKLVPRMTCARTIRVLHVPRADLYARSAQAQRLYWKDGGPVIGIQLENEYAGRGPNGGEEYILELKELAIRAAWTCRSIPSPDGTMPSCPRILCCLFSVDTRTLPWAGSVAKLPPSEVYAFRFGSRVSGDMGMLGRRGMERRQRRGPAATPLSRRRIRGRDAGHLSSPPRDSAPTMSPPCALS